MKTDRILKLIQQKNAMRSGGALPYAQKGLQYVSTPGSTYGNYYDPSTGEYIPQVYTKDVDIVADRELPFQNGKFAPFLASRGTADYVPVESMLLPGTPAIKGLSKATNFAIDAFNPLAGMRGLKSAPKTPFKWEQIPLDDPRWRTNIDDLDDNLDLDLDDDLFADLAATVDRMEKDKLRDRVKGLIQNDRADEKAFNDELTQLRTRLQFGNPKLEKPLYDPNLTRSIQDNLAEDALLRSWWQKEQMLRDPLSQTTTVQGQPFTFSPRAFESKRKMQDFSNPFGGKEAWRIGISPNKLGGLTKHQSKGVVNDERGSLNNMNVSDVWKQVTGSDWSQAKKLGLTDGSYEQNVALKAKLIANAKQKLAPAERPKIGAAPKPAAQKPKYQVQMPGVQRDATATRPSDQQRAYEFYSKQPFGVTDPNSRIPQNVQAAMMQAATQPDAVYETPTGVRSSLQSAYNQVARGTENDLANIVAGAVAYPLQGGLNITNAITGDVPIRSDADVLGLGLDALSLIPATKFVSNVRGVGRSLQRAGNGFLYPLSSNYRTGNVTQRFLADEARFPGLEVTRKGSRLAPKTITVKDVNDPDQYLKAIRHKDGSYHFQFDMSGVGPRRAGTAMQLLENQFKPLTQFKEVSTLSLDSYKNVLKRMSDSRYSVAPSGRTILNAQGVRNKFLDDLADPYFTNWDDYASGNLNANTAAAAQRWNEAGAPMYFSNKAAATEAAERLNSKYFGKTAAGDELAMPIKGDNRKWTISLPNYKLTKLKRLGGTSRIRIKKRK
jgi:hypothetical protein